MIFVVYKTFSDPDIKNKEDLQILETRCQYKHERLDEILDDMRTSLKLLKENDIKHIEQEIRIISERQNKILTILEYKGTLKEEEK